MKLIVLSLHICERNWNIHIEVCPTIYEKGCLEAVLKPSGL